MISIPTSPQKPTDVVRTAVVAWAKSLKKILPFAGLLTICMAAFQIYIYRPVVAYANATIETVDFHNTVFYQWLIEPKASMESLTPIIPPTIIYLLIVFLINITMIYHFHQIMQKNTPQFFDSFKVGFRKYIPFLAVFILYSLIVIIGYICLILPGIYLVFALMFAPYLLITQNLRIIESIKQSWGLVKNNWWRTLGTLLLGILMQIVFLGIMLSIVFCIALLVALVYQMISHFIPASIVMFSDFALVILISFLYCIAVAFLIFLILCMMYDLQIRKATAKTPSIQG